MVGVSLLGVNMNASLTGDGALLVLVWCLVLMGVAYIYQVKAA